MVSAEGKNSPGNNPRKGFLGVIPHKEKHGVSCQNVAKNKKNIVAQDGIPGQKR